ncbi:hypothetical protein FPOAC2_10819 [Fusarium poae]|uniref:hypothetical protein n=1 Tax=Fusarium poae TaxID=36050 RepID=UPI001CE7F638|nr:hypothetical protein FPOAC1_010538 [Fusarium poae]KAG8665737.1 hypothetical protein FPOAC1_010538 [Fusarium poae]
MSSNPPPPGGGPTPTNNAPPGALNAQPTANNPAQPVPHGANIQAAASNIPQTATNPRPMAIPRAPSRARPSARDELINAPERELQMLTDGLRERLEEAVKREARTDQELEDMGLDPREYDEDEIMNSVPNISVVDYEDLSGPHKRLKFSRAYIDGMFGGVDPYEADKKKDEVNELTLSLKHASLDMISALCINLELAIEIGKHLRPQDIVNLYIASRSFRSAINGHMLSCIRMWIDSKSPEAGKVFHWKLYGKMLIRDPQDRKSAVNDAQHLEARWNSVKLNPKGTRLIPGFRYLKMVLSRECCCREILAMMARMGFLMPESMYGTLLRLWVLMEISTTRQRQLFLRNEKYWTDQHLYNVQFFLVKLAMAFNHPFFHPIKLDMVHLMMGQKGLHPLWQLLMKQRYTNLSELMELKTRYDLRFPRSVWTNILLHDHPKAYNVPLRQVGLGHMEGWGKGFRHLSRPDELLPIEAVYRGLDLEKHISQMVIWGYIDFETGENIVPTEDDMYISDEEEKLGRVDTSYFWQRKHALKKRWNELSPEVQEEIKEDDNDERLRGMAWSTEGQYNWRGEWESASESDSDDDREYDINEEIERGYRLPSLFGKHPKKADANKDDGTREESPLATFGENTEEWNATITELFINSNPQVTRAQWDEAKAWHDYMEDGNSGPYPTGPGHENELTFSQTYAQELAQNQLVIAESRRNENEADDEDEDEDDEDEEYDESDEDEDGESEDEGNDDDLIINGQ